MKRFILPTMLSFAALSVYPDVVAADHQDQPVKKTTKKKVSKKDPKPAAVPELGAGGAGAGLAVIIGGALVAAGRRRRSE